MPLKKRVLGFIVHNIERIAIVIRVYLLLKIIVGICEIPRSFGFDEYESHGAVITYLLLGAILFSVSDVVKIIENFTEKYLQ